MQSRFLDRRSARWMCLPLVSGLACGQAASSDTAPAASTSSQATSSPAVSASAVASVVATTGVPSSTTGATTPMFTSSEPTSAATADTEFAVTPSPSSQASTTSSTSTSQPNDDSSSGPTDPLPTGAVPALSGLQVSPNPNNVLSCIVTWTTDVDATSEVRFGVGGYQFVIADPTPTKEHRVLVIGMRAGTEYQLQAASSTTSGSATLDGTFETGMLPSTVSKGVATTFDAEAVQAGWTLTNLMSGGPAVAIMFDMEGEPVWYYINGTSNDQRGDVSVDLLENGHVLIGPAPGEPPREVDLEGNIVWEGPDQGTNPMTHHAGIISNGNYGVIRDNRSGQLQGSQIDEVSPDNDVVWSWSIFDHLTPASGSNTDWCHGNSVTFDLPNDAVYLNCRFLGVIKIKYSTKAVEWGLGATFDQTALLDDFTFTPPTGQFSDAHHPKFDGKRVLLYDNGGFSQSGGFGGSPNSDFRSRVLEYAIDEATKTAEVVWEFPGDFEVDAWFTDEWYSPYWGDADWLENGNVFIDGAIRSTSKKARIFEVRPSDGKVVWQMELPTNIGTYRAERLTPPPRVRPYTAQ